MTNLFSVFDPQIFYCLPLNWISSTLVLLFTPCFFWIVSSHFHALCKITFSALHKEFNAILGNLASPGLTLLPLSLLFFILSNNFLGLYPYMFTSSSHLTFTVALALPLWLGHMMMGWMKTPTHMLAHLVPLGTPSALMPFMVLIELISNLIRPLTLSVRLAANMIAGHLLLTLLSSQAPNSSYYIFFLLIIALSLLGTLEIAVSLIQAYVFGILSTLYFNEINLPILSK